MDLPSRLDTSLWLGVAVNWKMILRAQALPLNPCHFSWCLFLARERFLVASISVVEKVPYHLANFQKNRQKFNFPTWRREGNWIRYDRKRGITIAQVGCWSGGGSLFWTSGRRGNFPPPLSPPVPLPFSFSGLFAQNASYRLVFGVNQRCLPWSVSLGKLRLSRITEKNTDLIRIWWLLHRVFSEFYLFQSLYLCFYHQAHEVNATFKETDTGLKMANQVIP